MKAISDINGLDIKNHEDIPQKLVECLRSWFSETVGLRNLNSSDKIYSDFIEFNTDLYREKTRKYAGRHTKKEAEGFADTEIQQMTLPEFIEEIKIWRENVDQTNDKPNERTYWFTNFNA